MREKLHLAEANQLHSVAEFELEVPSVAGIQQAEAIFAAFDIQHRLNFAVDHVQISEVSFVLLSLITE
ncbi:MAG: hypothetical protein RL256_724 [Actinomycetota bacterium]